MIGVGACRGDETEELTQYNICRKDRLKKNPVVSNDELNDVSRGLGDEAAEEFGNGKGKLGERIGKAFD